MTSGPRVVLSCRSKAQRPVALTGEALARSISKCAPLTTDPVWPSECSPCRYNLDSFQSGLVVSLSLFGALAGSAAAFVVGDPLGRKKELLLAALLYCELLALAMPGQMFQTITLRSFSGHVLSQHVKQASRCVLQVLQP